MIFKRQSEIEYRKMLELSIGSAIESFVYSRTLRGCVD